MKQDTASLPPFIATEIDDSVFRRINGVSYRENDDIRLSDLVYIPLLHYGFDSHVHRGEIICNKVIAEPVITVFRTLYRKRYQIQSIRLIEDFGGSDDLSMRSNNTSSFNYRPSAGGGKLSRHALGLAIDINPLYNPYVKESEGRLRILPEEAAPYVDRSKRFPHKITHRDSAYLAFNESGFIWGGDWETLKDYQHFEIPS